MENKNITSMPKQRGVLFNFFAFKRMTAITFIQILYPIGIFGLIAYTSISIYSTIQVNAMISSFEGMEGMEGFDSLPYRHTGSGQAILISVLMFIGLNLVWRLICEGWIVIFRIHSSLDKIEKNTQK